MVEVEYHNLSCQIGGKLSEKITSNASKVVRLRTYDMVNHVEVLVEYSVSDNLAVSDIHLVRRK